MRVLLLNAVIAASKNMPTAPKNARLLVKFATNVVKLDILKLFVGQRKNGNQKQHKILHKIRMNGIIFSVRGSSMLKNTVCTHSHLATCPLIKQLVNGCRNQLIKE